MTTRSSRSSEGAGGVEAVTSRAHDDEKLLAALRAGDEAAFVGLVTSWSSGMIRLARGHVSTDASAQEVVQDTWLAVLRGIDRFEQRSSLRTWVLRILVNTAKTRGVRESRVVPFAALDPDDDGPTVDPSRFRAGSKRWERHWTQSGAPHRWDGDPARGAVRGEVRELVEKALDTLPARQRAVVVLRDVEGLDPSEVCDILDVSGPNQRVLLHRGRSKVRALLEDYYRADQRL